MDKNLKKVKVNDIERLNELPEYYDINKCYYIYIYVVGENKSGKTSLIRSYLKTNFSNDYKKTKINIYGKKLRGIISEKNNDEQQKSNNFYDQNNIDDESSEIDDDKMNFKNTTENMNSQIDKKSEEINSISSSNHGSQKSEEIDSNFNNKHNNMNDKNQNFTAKKNEPQNLSRQNNQSLPENNQNIKQKKDSFDNSQYGLNQYNNNELYEQQSQKSNPSKTKEIEIRMIIIEIGADLFLQNSDEIHKVFNSQQDSIIYCIGIDEFKDSNYDIDLSNEFLRTIDMSFSKSDLYIAICKLDEFYDNSKNNNKEESKNLIIGSNNTYEYSTVSHNEDSEQTIHERMKKKLNLMSNCKNIYYTSAMLHINIDTIFEDIINTKKKEYINEDCIKKMLEDEFNSEKYSRIEDYSNTSNINNKKENENSKCIIN